MRRAFLAALLVLTAAAQTQVDFRTQVRNVDANNLSAVFSCKDAGALNAYVCNLTPPISAYTAGTTYWFQANTANTGPATINFNGLGAKTIVKQVNRQLTAGDINARQWVIVTYDGSAMQMQSQIANQGSSVSSVFGRTGPVAAQSGDYAFSQISGAVATGQLPATVMRADSDNTVTGGTQDMRGANHTLPMKSGLTASLPATCQAGETYFATDALAGSNVYGCTAANSWSPQRTNLTVESQGTVIGSRPKVNFQTGPGLLSAISDTGSQIDIQWALDTAVNQTQPGEQSGSALLCASASGSDTKYQCSLTPTLGAYTNGMTLHWKPDVNGAGGTTTLNVDTLGAVPVKLGDGASAPGAGDIVAGQLYNIWYDGAEFRIQDPVASEAISPGSQNHVLVYNSDGISAGPSDCAINAGVFSCGDGSTLSGVVLPELTVNGTNSFSLYGAGSQSVDGCIVLSGQPTNGQILLATSGTTTIDGKTCAVMQWAAIPAPGALAAAPTQCPAGKVSTGVQANGNANCTPAASGGTVTSVNITPPPGFTAGSAVTGAGNIILSRALPGASTFYASDDFIGAGYNAATTYVSSSAVYQRGDIAGTGKVASGAPLASSLGAWQLQSGAVSGNASTLAVSVNAGSASFGFIAAPSSTAFSYQTRVQLGSVANNYFGIGLYNGTGTLSREFTADQAVWCDVTNTSSAANWACHSTRYSGSNHQTDVATSSTADTSPHVFLFVMSTAEVDYYLDGVAIACLNTSGTGGCTQFVSSGGLPSGTLTVFYEAKTSASTAALLNIDKWEVWQ